jgi:hypothetical protein
LCSAIYYAEDVKIGKILGVESKKYWHASKNVIFYYFNFKTILMGKGQIMSLILVAKMGLLEYFHVHAAFLIQQSLRKPSNYFPKSDIEAQTIQVCLLKFEYLI